MDRLVIEASRPRVSQSNLVRLPDEAMHQVQKLQTRSGRSASYLVGKMIEFTAERVEIISDDDELGV